MTSPARKMPLFFYRTTAGVELVRTWLKALPEEDRHAIGADLSRVQFRWPVGMPLCRPMGQRLWEVRSTLPSRRIARLLFCIYDGEIWVLHGFIKKTAKTPAEDLAIARERLKEIYRW